MAGVIRRSCTSCVIVVTALLCSVAVADDGAVGGAEGETINLRLTLRDSGTGRLVPGRITVEQRPVGAKSAYHFVESLDPNGTAVPYDVTRSETSFEKHTTVSAHPFGATVPPGYYVVYYEHGPEWRGNKAQVQVKKGEVAALELTTSRWIDMNARGWYSGDTHVHRSVGDLPNIMRAEDLNVALPLSYWVREAYTPPSLSEVELRDKTVAAKPGLITVDPNRVIWPINTEYELFSINGQRHTQGAVFVLNHQQPLTLPAPPVAPIAAEARRQGALLDLDKHSWPWSMMLVPIMDVDLFELANNHIWRTEFFFKHWTQEMRPEGWNIETDGPLLLPSRRSTNRPQQPDGVRRGQPQAQTARGGFTEWGWIDFGFKSYYALLNCGFKLRPSAGTANGVHPVPLGYGRVYVECPDGSSVPATASTGDQPRKPARQKTQSELDGFSYDNWIQGLNAGRSFVTTGPMLFTTVNGQPPGSTIAVEGPTTVRVRGKIEAIHALKRVEILKNGRVVDVVYPEWKYESPWIWRGDFDVEVPVDGTSWVAVRCFEAHTSKPPWRIGFAHSSPVHIEMPGQPLRPRKAETDYFVKRMNEEIERNRDVLRPDELAEYERARDIYARIGETAVDDAETTNAALRSLVVLLDEVPAGWEFTDISETEWDVLGSNPVILSHPYLVGLFTGATRPDEADRADVLRSLVTFYHHPDTDRYALLCAHVCVNETSAKFTAELLKGPPNMIGRFKTWQRGDTVVWLSASKDMPDELFSQWAGAIGARLVELGPTDR